MRRCHTLYVEHNTDIWLPSITRQTTAIIHVEAGTVREHSRLIPPRSQMGQRRRKQDKPRLQSTGLAARLGDSLCN